MTLTVLNKIGTASILDNAITSGKIIDNAITSGKIINNAVTSSKIIAGAAGKVLQIVQGTSTGTFNTTSNTPQAVSNLSQAITTSAVNSKILITMNSPASMNGGSDNRAAVSIRSSIDSFAASLFEQIYASASNWDQLGNVLQFLHTHGQAAGTTITYTAYARKTNGSNPIYISDPWGSTTPNVPFNSTTLTEVAG